MKQYHAEQLHKDKIKTVMRQETTELLGAIVPYSLATNCMKATRIDQELVVLKFPNANQEFWGDITLYPLYYRLKIISTKGIVVDEKGYWNDVMRSVEQAVVVNEIKRVRFELDGTRILFSYFDKACGMLHRQLIFWGM